MKQFYGLLLTLLLVAPGQIMLQAQEPLTPKARGVQLVPDAPPADVYVDNVEPATFQNISYLSASRILTIAPGEHNLKVAPAGTSKDAAIIEETVTFGSDSGYVLVSTGRISTGDLQPVLLSRSLTLEPAPGQTHVRLFHGSPGISPLRISIVDLSGGTTEFGTLSFRSSTAFRSIPGGAIRLYVTNDAGDTLYGATGSLATGSVVTLMATGDPEGADFRINVLAERNESAVSPMPTLSRIVDTETGEIRLVNLYAGEERELDVTIGGSGSVTFPSMDFASASEILTLPAGDLALTIAPAGESTPIFEGTLTVIGGLYRAAYITGSEEDGNDDVVVLTADATSRPGQGEASVRFLNAYPDSAFFPVWIEYANGSEKHISLSSFGTFTPYEKVVPGSISVRFRESRLDPPVYVNQVSADSLYTIAVASNGTREVYLINDDQRSAIPELSRFGILASVRTGEIADAPVLQIAPNPANGQVRVDAPGIDRIGEKCLLTLFDSRGRLVASEELSGTSFQIGGMTLDLSSLPSGSYQMIIYDEESVVGRSSIIVVE